MHTYILVLFSLQREENGLKKLKLLEEEEQRKLAEKRQKKYEMALCFLYNVYDTYIHTYVHWSIGKEVGSPV